MSTSRVRWAALVAMVVVAAVALWAFEPRRLATSSTIEESAPASRETTPATQAATPTPTDTVPATGKFEDAEHATSGRVRLIELADGRRFVRLEGLSSSDGPDLHVWLSDRPSGGDWGSYDDGRHVALGDLKATHGNQNYAIPADVDLDGLTSVVIWCDRFNVAFGTAPVAA
ncbi:DM13 domain-containing protein [Nocardioides sp. B-3]|uniref:DM13 domain-containing protein n=1 Tax=Nocardioides sp. B-3 TaxID=2895565 RepID=UPI00215343BB|nr:DM13 domain-containing protein [Nocardioides sp. B-3]UUZ58769.1 DM13 domain-containing protein [Nocardioides sp. B-3]